MRRSLLILLVLTCTLAPARAEDLATRATVLIVNLDGTWDRVQQEKWDALTIPTPPNVRFVRWSQMFDTEGGRRLSADQEAQLLEHPDMLVSSQRRRELTSVPYLVIVMAKNPERGPLWPVLVDMATGEHLDLPTVKDGDPQKALDALGTAVSTGLARRVGAVWGYIPGKQYHLKGADHVRKDDVIIIDTESEAVRNGYEACAVCFPDNHVRKQDGLELELGRYVSSYIERRYGVDADQARQDRVNRVGQRIVEANGLDQFDYTFKVLQSDTVNAFAAGAGFVYVTRGLEKITAGNDDMLAAVLGHEIGHVTRHHVVRQYRQAQTFALLGAVISVATGSNLGALLADFAGGIISRGHGRRFEAEADRCGVIYAYGASYRPEDFELVMNALRKLNEGKSKGPDWLATHPTEDKRLQMTHAVLAELKALDAVAASYSVVDPKLTTYIRQNAGDYVDRKVELQEELVVWQTALGPGPAPAAVAPAETGDEGYDDRPPLELPEQPQAQQPPVPVNAVAPTPTEVPHD